MKSHNNQNTGKGRIASGVADGVSAVFDGLDLVVSRALGRTPKSMPLLYIDLLQRCNLRCVTCGFASDYPVSRQEMTTEQIRKILQDSRQLHTRIVSFGGGEPFLRDDLVELIEICENLGLAAHVNTNGTRLNEETMERLRDFQRLTLVVSLDHPDPDRNDGIRGSGVFERVRDTVTRLRERAPNVHVGINCVISRKNVASLEDMVRLAGGWGVDSIKFTPFHDNLNHRWREYSEEFRLSSRDLPVLSRQLEAVPSLAKRFGMMTNSRMFLDGILEFVAGRTPEIPCYAGYLYGNIDPYGFLFPCYDHRERLDVLESGLVAAWKSPAMQRMRRRVRTCSSHCWNTGNAEPSIRLHPGAMGKYPGQLWEDLRFYLFLSEKR